MSAWRAIKLHTTPQTQRSIAPVSAAHELDAVSPRARAASSKFSRCRRPGCASAALQRGARPAQRAICARRAHWLPYRRVRVLAASRRRSSHRVEPTADSPGRVAKDDELSG